MSRTHNAVVNICTGLFNKMIILFFPFIIKAILIKKMGVEYLGLNSLFTSILQVLNVTELGLSSAIIFSMYKPIVEKDENTICALLSFYKKVYRIIGLIILIIGVCLLPFLTNLINGSYPQNINIYVLYLMYLLNVVITYFLFAYKTALLVAEQRNDLVNNISSIIYILQYSLQIVIICKFKNYYMYVMVNFFTNVLNNILVEVVSKIKYSNYICKGSIDKELKKSIQKKVYGLAMQKICYVTRNSLDSIFISAFLGLSTVAIYNNYYYIMNAITGILTIICSNMTASIGNSIASESIEKNYSDMIKFDYIYMWLSGFCTVCLFCLYQPFMQIWMGSEYMFSTYVVICFCLYFYTLKMGDIRSVYSSSAGLWYEGRYVAVIETILNIFLNFFFGKLFGVIGIILATEISLLFVNFCYGSTIIFKFYFKNNKLIEYFKYHMFYAIITFFIIIITYCVCEIIPDNSIKNFLIKGIICLIVPNMIYLVIYNRTKNFKESKKFFLDRIKLFDKN